MEGCIRRFPSKVYSVVLFITTPTSHRPSSLPRPDVSTYHRPSVEDRGSPRRVSRKDGKGDSEDRLRRCWGRLYSSLYDREGDRETLGSPRTPKRSQWSLKMERDCSISRIKKKIKVLRLVLVKRRRHHDRPGSVLPKVVSLWVLDVTISLTALRFGSPFLTSLCQMTIFWPVRNSLVTCSRTKGWVNMSDVRTGPPSTLERGQGGEHWSQPRWRPGVVYVCVCTRTCVCVVCLCVSRVPWSQHYECVNICLCVRVCLCVYMCLCVRTCVSVYVCVCVWECRKIGTVVRPQRDL